MTGLLLEFDTEMLTIDYGRNSKYECLQAVS